MKASTSPKDLLNYNRLRRHSAVPMTHYDPKAVPNKLITKKPKNTADHSLTERLNRSRTPVCKPAQLAEKPFSSKLSDIIGLTHLDTVTGRSSSVAHTSGRVENYTIGKQLGHGAYASVKLAVHRVTKLKYAIKTYEKTKLIDPQRKQSVKREIRILQKLSHPRIIQVFETFESPRHINIVMEYVGDVSLHSYIRRHSSRKLSENEARRLFRQIVEGIEHCHRLAIVHRDIKLENILLDEHLDVKVIDFGFATCMPADLKSRVFCGTPSYMAPEIVERRDYSGPPVDIWALGVLLFAMLCGTFPFKGITDKELYRKISKGVFLIPPGISETAKATIISMIATDANSRPSCCDLLKQKWLNEISPYEARPLRGEKENLG